MNNIIISKSKNGLGYQVTYNCANCGVICKQAKCRYDAQKYHFCSIECKRNYKKEDKPLQEGELWKF